MLVDSKLYLDECCEALSKVDRFSCDTETTGFSVENDRLIGISFATGVKKKEAWWFAFDDVGFIPTMKVLYQFLNDPKKQSIWHNAKFDLKFLKRNGYEVENQIHDTMLLAYLDNENRVKAKGKLALKGQLGLAMQLFKKNLPTYKDSALANNTLFPIKTADDYATDDVIYCFKVFNKLYPIIQADPSLNKFYHELAMPIVRVLVDMELSGVLIDVDYLKEAEKKVLEKQDEFEKNMFRIAGREFLSTSNEQVSKILYGANGLGLTPGPDVPVGKKGHYSVASETFETLWDNEFVGNLLFHRGASKLLSTYIKPLRKRALQSDDGRIRGSFHQCGTVTGRFSSSGPNLQNMPRNKDAEWKYRYPLRNCFIAPEGKKLIVADYGQLELRVMAHRSQDPLMLKVYEEGGDIHKQTQDLLGIERPLAKETNFGLIYLMGAQTFQKQLKNKARLIIPLEKCKRIKTDFFNSYSGIKRYHKIIEAQVRNDRVVYTILGRPRRLAQMYKINEYEAIMMATNAVISGSAADIMLIAMRNLASAIKKKEKVNPSWNSVKILLQVHDELLLEANEDIAQDVADVMKYEMENAVTLSVPLVAEPNIGDNWGEIK